jgi:hypothetical protein
MKVMDIKPRATTELDVFNDWCNSTTAKLIANHGKKIAIKTGTQIPVQTDIFHNYGWKIDVKTPMKELYKRTYGENWGFHHQIYMAWNTRNF